MHRASAKTLQGKGYTSHVVHTGTAIAGFTDEASALSNAHGRNEKAVRLGVKQDYTVAPASEAEYFNEELNK